MSVDVSLRSEKRISVDCKGTRIEVENMILPFFSLGNFTDNLMHRTKRNEASYQKYSGWDVVGRAKGQIKP